MSGEVAFGLAISEDRKLGAIVAAGRSGPGKILVDLAPFYGPPALMAERCDELYVRHDPVAVVLNPRSQASTLIRALGERGILLTPVGAEDMAVAHGEFLDLVNDGGLAHLDQRPLTDAVRAAAQKPVAGAQAWDPRVGVDQSPLVAATLAVWAFCRWEALAQPGAWAV